MFGNPEPTASIESAMDELDARVRSLNAERNRPEPQPPTTEELLARLIGTLAALYRTPPDEKR